MLGSGGLIHPQPGYLEGMRELADRYQVLLVFDEVITFRLSRGGLQEHEGVSPDLTALGKLIGGGYPVGAFGGRSEIMARFDPSHPESVAHSEPSLQSCDQNAQRRSGMCLASYQ